MTKQKVLSNIVGQNKNQSEHDGWYNYVGQNKMNKFGKELRRRREAFGWSQDELADRSGISKGYISTLERNQPHSITGALPKPTKPKVISLANALDWDPNEACLMAGLVPSDEGNFINLDSFCDSEKKKILNFIEFLKFNREKSKSDNEQIVVEGKTYRIIEETPKESIGQKKKDAS